MLFKLGTLENIKLMLQKVNVELLIDQIISTTALNSIKIESAYERNLELAFNNV